jgi:hypothetical protein
MSSLVKGAHIRSYTDCMGDNSNDAVLVIGEGSHFYSYTTETW